MELEKVIEAFLAKVPMEAIENDEGLTPMKLQKLLFFAQEESLYRSGVPLFDQEVEAWKHGFVIREAWNMYSGKEPILKSPKNPDLDEGVQEIIDAVWSEYGEKEDWALSNITHDYLIWKNKGFYELVSKDEIREYRHQIEAAKQEGKTMAMELLAKYG